MTNAGRSRYEIAIRAIEEIETGVDQSGIEAADFARPPGTFFDAAPLHVLTDATLNALRTVYPEEGWSGRTLAIGDQVGASVLVGTIRPARDDSRRRSRRGAVRIDGGDELAVVLPPGLP
jgi:hypothetical protein